MRIKKISLILVILFLFVLSFGFVNANEYWGQEANVNYDLGLGTRFIAYGSNYLNPIENLTGSDYILCPITKSDYTPIISDFGQTGVLKVVVTDKSTDKLSIYNSDCTLFAEINVGENIIAMPVLLRPKSYFNQQIVVLTSIHLRSYEYDIDLGYFVLDKNIALPCSYGYLTCLDEYWDSERNLKCIIVTYSPYTSSITIIDMVNGTYTYKPLGLGIFSYGGYNGLSSFRNPIDDYNFYIPVGFHKILSGRYVGSLLNETAHLLTYYYGGGFSYSYSDIFLLDSSDFVAKIGNSYRIFSYRYTGDAGNHRSLSSVFINDLSGNNLFYIVSEESHPSAPDMTNIAYKRFSNWAVADYDKDGLNEACFLVKKVNDEIWLQCYESTLSQSNGDIRVNYTGIMDNISNFVLADFVPSKNVLGIATREGIFYPNDKVFSTNKTADFGFPITTFKDSYSQTPMYVYTDNDEGFIIYADIEIDSCGNGDCEYWENPLSCYEDCYQMPPVPPVGNGSLDTLCETDVDCNEGLRCVYGVCSKSGFKAECNYNLDCISGSCINGKCTRPSLWQNVEASKDEMYGDDVHTNNFLSLIVIIVVAGVIGYYMVIWAGIATFFMLAIFFTLVGWLNPFILVGLFLIGTISLVFGLLIGATSH